MDSKPQYSRAPAAPSITKRSRISKASYGGMQVIVDYRKPLAQAYIVQPVNTRIYLALILPSCFAGLALWLFTTICNSRLPMEKPGVYRQTSSGARVLTAAMVLYMIMVLLICWAITDGFIKLGRKFDKINRQLMLEDSLTGSLTREGVTSGRITIEQKNV